MNYPIWELYTLGGGSLVALIAVLHVYISHLAVGGGMFIWLTDLKGYKDNDEELHRYVKKHTWFFLLLTMVFGGMSGVGIWFIIALVNPAATSALIHNFVFGWAIEWVFFLGEITALLVYYYHFDKLGRRHRLNIAFLYFLFAWLSLFIINGILSFMLTPGDWLTSGNFWDGFFNPTFVSSLLFRTFMTMIIAGLFGYVTSVFIKDDDFRMKMMHYCSKWLLYPLAGLIPSAYWYMYAIPPTIRETAFVINPQTAPFIQLFVVTTIIIFIFGIFLSLRVGNILQRVLTFVLVAIGLVWMGGFEYTREDARKPFIINHYMYSTSVHKADVERLNEEGVLATARWSAIKQVNSENVMQAGRELFNLQCMSCHTVNGIRNDIIDKTAGMTRLGIMAQLTGQGKVKDYMPGFVGTREEMSALATYISTGLHPGQMVQKIDPLPQPGDQPDLVPFDSKSDEYVLLAWSTFGVHMLSDSDPFFSFSPPDNTIEAQLIRRGEVPELVSDDVELVYVVEEGYDSPSERSAFWQYAKSNFGAEPEPNKGMTGNGLQGKFTFDDEKASFIAAGIPLIPYKRDGSYSPFVNILLEAKSAESGEVIASTRIISAVASQLGCRNCHGGPWGHVNLAGISGETAKNILKSHDRLSGTDLTALAEAGQPQACQQCHADTLVNMPVNKQQLNLSASMHGWHANYMPVDGAQACVLCHPAENVSSRGVHQSIGLSCVECHGELADHALALLAGAGDKPGVQRLMANLDPVQVETKDEISARMPWVNQPDCMNCHEDYAQPEEIEGFNKWVTDYAELYRNRPDNAGIRCPACHGSTHALYPAGANADNAVPLQYTGTPLPVGSDMKCAVCHMQDMEDPVHHENMYRMFRNTQVVNKN